MGDPELTVREALSGISGSISITAWLFLLLPQLWENYCNQSAEALSIAFLVVWGLGDVANLAGAIWDGLLPTVIAIGVYFCFIDGSLLGQVTYYKLRARGKIASTDTAAPTTVTDDPTQPLLADDQRRHSAASRRRSSAAQLPFVREGQPETEQLATGQRWLRNFAAVLGVSVLGALVWAAAWQSGSWVPTSPGNEDDSERILGAEILGYISAVLYLAARLPQIWKNYREKSCDGLSVLFFMLSTLGNLSYGLQIFFHSTSAKYILKNLPWILGSIGTILEDMVIFAQFQVYARNARKGSVAVE